MIRKIVQNADSFGCHKDNFDLTALSVYGIIYTEIITIYNHAGVFKTRVGCEQ